MGTRLTRGAGWRGTTVALMVLALGTAQAAWAQAETTSFPFTFPLTNPCTFEPLVCEGSNIFTIQEQTDASAGTHVILVGRTPAECTGASGTRCRLLENSLSSTQAHTLEDGATVFMSTGYARWICEGPGNDFEGHAFVRYTVTNDGTLTAVKADFDPRACREPGGG